VIEQEFRRFGPYVLLRCSGAGGFGRVDLAVKGPPELAKVCVVKRMQKSEEAPDLEARFRREAQIALRLTHGAIAQTVGVEEIDGELCLLQEYVDGVNLRHLERQCAPDRVPLPVALYIGREVARALAYAHALGIVHRDVTPENIMLAFDGQVKLIDFGIARESSAAALTQTGVVIGRETYTAPEVWSGATADARSDLFSLGVVLWQLVTGRSFQDAQTAVGAAAPDPSLAFPALPRDVADLVLRALAPEPGRRFQSAREVVEALGRFLPPAFHAEDELAQVLAGYYNIDRERQILKEDVEAAKRMLAAPTVVPAHSEPNKRRVRRLLFLAAAAGLVALLGGIGTALKRRQARSLLLPSVVTSAAVSPRRPFASTDVRPTSPTIEAASHPAVPAPVVARTTAAVTPTKTRPQKVARAGGTTALVAANSTTTEALRRARQMWDDGDVAGALTIARLAVRQGGGAEAHVLVGTLLLKQGQRLEAERELQEALRLDPENGKAQRVLELARGGAGQ